MSTFEASYASKTSWLLRLIVTESNLNAAANTSDVTEALYMVRGDSAHPFVNGTTAFSVGGPAGGSGSFGAYRFGPANEFGSGLPSASNTDYSGTAIGGAILLYQNTVTVAHDPDGSKTITVSASHAAAATLGTATIGSTNIALTTLTAVPGTPTGVTASRVDDTQTQVGWTAHDASNGASTQNQIQQQINDGAWADAATISAAPNLTLGTAANRKCAYRVLGSNAAGSSAYSAPSAPIFTTPAAPTGVTATKDAFGNIIVAFTDNVAYTEHQHGIEHGTITGGVTTWDGTRLTTVAAGSTTYTHTSPNPSQVHVYRVWAETGTGTLPSAQVVSNTVLLLAAPNKPTFPAFAPFQDKGAAWVPTWTHNPVDSTAQTAYEFGTSTDGGATWASTGKVSSTVSSRTITANTYPANTAVTIRVRTWGQATTGGSDGTGASPWSDLATVTFKTAPVATITSPGTSLGMSALTVQLGFSQAESATFVQATVRLYQGAALLETKTVAALTVPMDTRLANGVSYTIKATVKDSNGLTSAEVSKTVAVTYTPPPAPLVTCTYLPDQGMTQINVTVPAAGVGQATPVSLSILRTITTTETLFDHYTAGPGVYTFLDPTPTINGTNTYTVETWSVDGVATPVLLNVVTTEEAWAFFSKGDNFTSIIRVTGKLSPKTNPQVASALISTEGRVRPIGLYGIQVTRTESGTADIVTGETSSRDDIVSWLKLPGRACYRDPSGVRMFGRVTGQTQLDTIVSGTFSYAIDETD